MADQSKTSPNYNPAASDDAENSRLAALDQVREEYAAKGVTITDSEFAPFENDTSENGTGLRKLLDGKTAGGKPAKTSAPTNPEEARALRLSTLRARAVVDGVTMTDEQFARFQDDEPNGESRIRAHFNTHTRSTRYSRPAVDFEGGRLAALRHVRARYEDAGIAITDAEFGTFTGDRSKDERELIGFLEQCKLTLLHSNPVHAELARRESLKAARERYAKDGVDLSDEEYSVFEQHPHMGGTDLAAFLDERKLAEDDKKEEADPDKTRLDGLTALRERYADDGVFITDEEFAKYSDDKTTGEVHLRQYLDSKR